MKDALNICKKYHNININTLIVKDKEQLTIWIEEKSIIESENRINESQGEAATNDRLPTKKVTKRYRGQVYEETVVDWSAVQQLDRQNKPARKYRGQYID